MMRKDLEFLKGICIAHRGLHNEALGIPENSMAAFREAVSNNLPIEVDLHLLKDGNVIIFHDDNLKRLTGVDKAVRDCTYDEIKDLRLQDTDEKIPLFRDFLTFIDSRVLLDIEIKIDNPVGVLEQKISQLLDNYKGQFVVKSFNPLSVKWFRKHRPDYIRGLISFNFKGVDDLSKPLRIICKHMLLNFLAKPDFIAYQLESLPNRKIARYRKRKYPILVWTVRSEQQLVAAKEYADSFICENFCFRENLF